MSEIQKTKIQKLPRNPLRFDLLDLFTEHGREGKVSLHHPETMSDFLKKSQESIENSLQNKAILHGLKANEMFEGILASFGNFQLLKTEDVGSIYSGDENLKIPDFRVVLESGENWLIEVKNFHGKDELGNLSFEKNYLNGLIRYSELTGGKLKIATYWSKWKSWTLVDPSVLKEDQSHKILNYIVGTLANEMGTIGDWLIGTEFPLKIRLLTDSKKDRRIKPNGDVSFGISGVEFYCRNKKITRKEEQKIFSFLIHYGDWGEEPTQPIIIDNMLASLDFIWMPSNDNEQGFEFIGYLSSMYSRYFISKILEEGQISKLKIEIKPGFLGSLIPEDYKGEALPLWRMKQKPNDSSEILETWGKYDDIIKSK